MEMCFDGVEIYIVKDIKLDDRHENKYILPPSIAYQSMNLWKYRTDQIVKHNIFTFNNRALY